MVMDMPCNLQVQPGHQGVPRGRQGRLRCALRVPGAAGQRVRPSGPGGAPEPPAAAGGAEQMGARTLVVLKGQRKKRSLERLHLGH